jgi:HPr kinase/phosphorylase
MPEISVRGFFQHVEEPLQLALIAGDGGLDRTLRSTRIQKPGLALAGYTDFVHDDRVQILGQTELSYLGTLSREAQEWSIDAFLQRKVACIVVTKGLPVPELFLRACNETATPLLVTPMTSSECIRKILAYLDDLLSPRCSLHAVLVDVDGVGVLITGSSGIGKSECALDLVARGHRLVADDVVEIRRRGEDLVGQASKLIQDLVEIRGLGILNVAELYGVAATRDHKRIELHVELESWSLDVAYDRTGLEERAKDILGVGVRSLVIPVTPGRNIAGIVEVAARNLLLQFRGHHAARELNRRILAAARVQEGVSLDGGATADLRVAAGLAEVNDHIEDEVE